MYKKGQQLKLLMKAVLLLALVSVIFWMIYSFAVKGAGAGVSETLLEKRIEFCAAKSKNTQFQPGGYQDKDADGILDSCDICVFKDKSGKWVGRNDENSDSPAADLMPDACDENPGDMDKSPKCDSKKNLVWDKDNLRCKIKST